MPRNAEFLNEIFESRCSCPRMSNLLYTANLAVYNFHSAVYPIQQAKITFEAFFTSITWLLTFFGRKTMPPVASDGAIFNLAILC